MFEQFEKILARVMIFLYFKEYKMLYFLTIILKILISQFDFLYQKNVLLFISEDMIYSQLRLIFKIEN